jgi:hypothetical protein
MHRLAFEYLMAYYLLQKDIEQVIWCMNAYLNNFDYKGIPIHYEEALLVYKNLTLAGDEFYDSYPVSAATRDRFDRYAQAYKLAQGEAGTISNSWKNNLEIHIGFMYISLNLQHYKKKMKRTGIRFFANSFGVIFMFLLFACKQPPGNDFSNILQEANIYPPYQGTVIPYNIAPLNFMIREEGMRFVVRFAVAGKDSFDISCKGKVSIPLRKWEKLLTKHRGGQMEVSILPNRLPDGRAIARYGLPLPLNLLIRIWYTG